MENKVFDLKTNTLTVTGDIVFRETIILYKIISSDNYFTSQFLHFSPVIPSSGPLEDSTNYTLTINLEKVDTSQTTSPNISHSILSRVHTLTTSIHTHFSPLLNLRQSTRVKLTPTYTR